jgi:predicted aspartyl protease
MIEVISQERGPRLSFEQAYAELQQILDLLANMDLQIVEFGRDEDIIRRQWEDKYPFPIVRDGADGIRVKRERDGHFKVWFTNGFEKPEDPQRVEIVQKLTTAGFDVVR